mmetsp:Transcript_96589/g.300835  ORF Transcript_96589/g.300835 Transcript_96589/m.300835 type:complete len:271 (+) Transcript_96589:506-1318(+)
MQERLAVGALRPDGVEEGADAGHARHLHEDVLEAPHPCVQGAAGISPRGHLEVHSAHGGHDKRGGCDRRRGRERGQRQDGVLRHVLFLLVRALPLALRLLALHRRLQQLLRGRAATQDCDLDALELLLHLRGHRPVVFLVYGGHADQALASDSQGAGPLGPREGRRTALPERPEQGLHVRPLAGVAARHREEDEAAEREDVAGRLGQGEAQGDLRRHPRPGATQRLGVAREHAREAEVQELGAHDARGARDRLDKRVPRLQVAVDDPGLP